MLRHPLMVGKQGVIHVLKPLPVSGGLVVFPFAPGHDLRPGGTGVKARKALTGSVFAQLAADIAILMLARVHIIQRLLKIECPPAIAAEHEDER